MKRAWEKYAKLPVQGKASFWFLICSFLQKGISVITTPIFTRLLSTAEYGQYGTFDSWLKIVTIFVTLHLYSGVFTQGMVKFSEDRRRFASSMQGLSLTLCLGWTLLYLAGRSHWNRLLSLTTVQMLAMLVMIWATAAFNFWAAEKRVEYRYRALVAVTLAVSLAKPAVGILLVRRATDKVTARILGLALVELVGYTGFFFIQMARGRKFCSAKYWRHALLFNIPLIPHYLSQTVLNSADRIMIKEMVGKEQAGIYHLAYSISQIMVLFNTALSHTLSPWIYQKIKDGRSGDIAGIAYISLGIIAGVNLAVIAVAPEAVAVFAPPEYHEAIWVIPPVAMSVLFMFSYDLFAKFEFYFEKTKYIMAASSVGAVLNLVLNYIFIRRYGYYAAAYTTLLCYIIYAAVHYLLMRRVCRQFMDGAEVYDPRLLVALYAGFLCAGFALMGTYRAPAVRYGVIVVALAAAWFRRKDLRRAVERVLRSRKAGRRGDA